ncbi:hypothetical protein LINPERHAP1_LOCUS19947 [Linum perenne]
MNALGFGGIEGTPCKLDCIIDSTSELGHTDERVPQSSNIMQGQRTQPTQRDTTGDGKLHFADDKEAVVCACS